MAEKQPTYAELRHQLDTKMIEAEKLELEPQRRNFVTSSFAGIHHQLEQKTISHGDYIKLINRLAAFKGGEYNDYVDLMAGAAQVGMLDMVVKQAHPVFSPEEARNRSQAVTDIFGIQPVKPEE
jgi:hypothetical protein